MSISCPSLPCFHNSKPIHPASSIYTLAPAAGLRTTGGGRLELRASLKQISDRFSSQDMAGVRDNLSVHVLRNCKIIHLVRHAQGYHNVAGENDYSAYMSYDYVDARLTPLGLKQVEELRKHLTSIQLLSRVELIVTSPLMRTMQTAIGAFGGSPYVEGDPLPPLMVANANGSKTAISSSGCPSFLAVELCREHVGVHPCDKWQSISTYRTLFPGVDFSEVESDEDILWKPDVRETDEELIARGKLFLEWLARRKEREIVVVSHSGFLTHMLSVFGLGCSASIQKELRKGFNNCEMRSIVLVNQRDLGIAIPEDYAGGSPPGPDLPSGGTDTKIIENGL